jgi:transcription elongation GreA/GreB family factor
VLTAIPLISAVVVRGQARSAAVQVIMEPMSKKKAKRLKRVVRPEVKAEIAPADADTERTADERAELEALRAQKRQLEVDTEILRRAIAFFGKEIR